MHDESTKQPCCNPPWEPPQVIPAQVRRVNNLIFRKINQFHRENNVDNVTPMHDWIMSYLYWHKNEAVYQLSLIHICPDPQKEAHSDAPAGQ